MNETAVAKQEYPPSQAEQVDRILYEMEDRSAAVCLKRNINLLRRQAQKAGNQRKTIRDLAKHHRATIMENRWLREAIRQAGKFGELGERNWEDFLAQARETLWQEFKKEIKVDNKAQVQVDRLAAFLMGGVPGEPFRSEAAVDAAIRLIKEQQKTIKGFQVEFDQEEPTPTNDPPESE